MGERSGLRGVGIGGRFISALDSELICGWVLSDVDLCSEPLADCTVLLLSATRQSEKIFACNATHPCTKC